MDIQRVDLERLVMVLPALLLLGVLFFWPLVGMLTLSIFEPDLTLRHYASVLGSESQRRVLVETVMLAAVVTGACLAVGYPVAYWLSSTRGRLAGWTLLAIVLPYLTSYLVRTYAWMVLLGRQGVINTLLLKLGVIDAPVPLLYTFHGLVVAMIHVLLPSTIIILLSVMKGIDSQLVRAAASLGGGPLQRFWRVFFPLSAPGVVAAGLLVFISALGFYVTPALLGGPRAVTLAMLIDAHMNYTLNWSEASAIAVVLLAVTMALYLLSNRIVGIERLLGAGTRATESPGQSSAPGGGWYFRLVDGLGAIGHRLRALGGGLGGAAWSRVVKRLGLGARDLPAPAGRRVPHRLFVTAWSLAVVALLLAPVAIIIPISFSSAPYLTFPPPGLSLRWYAEYFFSSDWLEATWRSLYIGVAAAALSVAVGGLAALGLTRAKRRLRSVAYTLLLTPLIVPGIVSAVALYFLFARIGLTGTTIGLVLAHSIGAVPVVLLIVAASLQAFDDRLEQAAASLGAPRIATIRRIVVPLILPGLVTAAFLAFLHSFDEVIYAIFLSAPSGRTLPVKIWTGIREAITPVTAAVSTLLIALTILLYVAVQALRRVHARQREASSPHSS